MPKSIFESKTLWAAVIAEVIALLETYGATDVISPATLAVIMPLLFGFLRLITDKPVVVTPPEPPAPTLRNVK